MISYRVEEHVICKVHVTAATASTAIDHKNFVHLFLHKRKTAVCSTIVVTAITIESEHSTKPTDRPSKNIEFQIHKIFIFLFFVFFRKRFA